MSVVRTSVHCATLWAERVARVAVAAAGLRSVATNCAAVPAAWRDNASEVMTYPVPLPISSALQWWRKG